MNSLISEFAIIICFNYYICIQLLYPYDALQMCYTTSTGSIMNNRLYGFILFLAGGDVFYNNISYKKNNSSSCKFDFITITFITSKQFAKSLHFLLKTTLSHMLIYIQLFRKTENKLLIYKCAFKNSYNFRITITFYPEAGLLEVRTVVWRTFVHLFGFSYSLTVSPHFVSY